MFIVHNRYHFVKKVTDALCWVQGVLFFGVKGRNGAVSKYSDKGISENKQLYKAAQ